MLQLFLKASHMYSHVPWFMADELSCSRNVGQVSGDGDGPGDDGDGPSNIADPVDDADEEDEDALELEQIERELCGDFAEVDIAMLEQELQSTMEEQDDLADMDRLHRVFVEVASEKQHKDAFCAGDIESNDGNLEKDIGDVLLEHYLSQSPNEQQSCAAKKEHATATTALDASSINDSLIAWSSSMEHFLSSMEPIANQLKAFDVSAVDSCLGHDLSLVITENDAVYVSWLQPYKNLTGRSVQLDDDGGGIYPSHFRPKQNFSGSVIVAPSCGVRVKKKDRQIMPHDFQRLRQSCLAAFQVVVDDADFFIFDDDGAGRNCIACHQSSSSPSDLPPQRCSVCLKLWHSNCSKQAALRLANFAQLHKVPTLDQHSLEPCDLPFFLLSLPYLFASHHQLMHCSVAVVLNTKHTRAACARVLRIVVHSGSVGIPVDRWVNES